MTRLVPRTMTKGGLTIGFVRRGYSPSGGAEAYLKRLARGVNELGHSAKLFTTRDWPAQEWSFGDVVRVRAHSPVGFANEIENLRTDLACDTLVSLERICRADVYRAGDGVHQAWLNRREQFEPPWRKWARAFNRKHRELLRLEETLLHERGAERVIANSRMVRDEIVDLYSYRRDRIDIVYNGIPLDHYRHGPAQRDEARRALGLTTEDIILLFAGSGWERKGLRYAIDAIESCDSSQVRMIVAGRGDEKSYQSSRVRFVGELADLRPLYFAADIFILPTIYDPFSNACLEAMACGLPVITTCANGFHEIMEDRIHGSVVDRSDDVDDLVSALDDWADPTRRAAARPNILQRAAQFDINRNVNQTLKIIMQVASQPPAA